MEKIGSLFLATAFLLFGVSANAGESAQTEKAELERRMCQKTGCQRNLRVVLQKKDGTTYDRTFDIFPPVVQTFGATVVAGQTINIEADISGDRLTNFKAVEKIVKPERTITAKFEQMEDGGMMLSIKNPFQKAIKFNMGIMPLDADRLYKTSSCPVTAGGSSFEIWPYPIFQVVLGNARLIKGDSKMDCVE